MGGWEGNRVTYLYRDNPPDHQWYCLVERWDPFLVVLKIGTRVLSCF